MKLLIAGDSFAADWSKKYPDQQGWPNHLAHHHQVDNRAQAGCSEYRILQQLRSADLKDYDIIIVSHTSPYRVYTDYHPLRHSDSLHHHCDLIYADVAHLAHNHKDYQAAQTWFEKFFSLEYANFCHTLVREKISLLLAEFRCIEISHMPGLGPVDIDFSELASQHQGNVNHYDEHGNQTVCSILLKKIAPCK